MILLKEQRSKELTGTTQLMIRPCQKGILVFCGAMCFIKINALQIFLVMKLFSRSGNAVQIVHRYHFASHLKRMSVIVRAQEKFLVFAKVNYAH